MRECRDAEYGGGRLLRVVGDSSLRNRANLLGLAVWFQPS